MKNTSKNNRFLTCFRPVVDIDAILEPGATVADRTSSQRFACIPVADKHDTKNSVTKATFSDQDLARNSVVLVPPPSKRTFSKVIKAVVFETLLNTRVRNKNHHGQTQRCFGSSKRGYSTCDEKQAFVVANIQAIKVPEWSSTISSSNSPVSESKIESTKEQVLVEKQKKSHCVGIYWVLISLAVTVFWGKVNVIILTSLLLWFFWIWNASREKGVPKLRIAESKVYKNRRRDHSGRGWLK
ncbi:hypothetical protein Fmac_019352 [Flemingia macrophylla]|uniref:Transmembrane protein n=1 Tax=Flemingia macrophylla TaxID=520843 RepID=A0ABD1M7Q7_9FABA